MTEDNTIKLYITLNTGHCKYLEAQHVLLYCLHHFHFILTYLISLFLTLLEHLFIRRHLWSVNNKFIYITGLETISAHRYTISILHETFIYRIIKSILTRMYFVKTYLIHKQCHNDKWEVQHADDSNFWITGATDIFQ